MAFEGLRRRLAPSILLALTATLGGVWAQQQTRRSCRIDRRSNRSRARGPVRATAGSRNGRRRASPSTSRGRRWSTAQHPTPRAKFPVIDIHSHQPTPISAAELDSRHRRDGAEQPAAAREPERRIGGAAEGRASTRCGPARTRIAWCSSPTSTFLAGGVGAGFGARAAQQLDADIKAGARGLKIFKDLGLRIKRTDGSRLKLDDPELDPIWDAARPSRACRC